DRPRPRDHRPEMPGEGPITALSLGGSPGGRPGELAGGQANPGSTGDRSRAAVQVGATGAGDVGPRGPCGRPDGHALRLGPGRHVRFAGTKRQGTKGSPGGAAEVGSSTRTEAAIARRRAVLPSGARRAAGPRGSCVRSGRTASEGMPTLDAELGVAPPE